MANKHKTDINLNMTQDSSKVIVALDYEDINTAKQLVSQLSPNECKLKVGKEMFTLFGPDWVRCLVDSGFDVFLDLKFHDIPNTVNKAIKAAANLGVWMVNVHASGGSDMIQAAKEGCLCVPKSPLLTAVTILTSMDNRQFEQVYTNATSIEQQVSTLAMLAQSSGADGVVCSAKEAVMLRNQVQSDFKLVTPGIRPVSSSSDDQKRVMTPEQAIQAGVDYLVIGRPITQHKEPFEALQAINQAILDIS